MLKEGMGMSMNSVVICVLSRSDAPCLVVFFILLTGVNLLNLVLFRVGTIAAQSSAASLGQAVTMIMSQHIILSLHDWRAISTGSPSSHEMGPVSYAGNGHTTTGGGGGSGGIGGRLRNLGTNRGASQAASPSIPGGHEVYGGTTSSITFEPAVANGGRRGSKHGVSQSPHSRSVVKEFVRSRKGSSEDEHEGPLEIRVQVQEEVKLDYDSVYTDPSDPNYPNSRPEVCRFEVCIQPVMLMNLVCRANTRMTANGDPYNAPRSLMSPLTFYSLASCILEYAVLLL